jgi:hypothetical protein
MKNLNKIKKIINNFFFEFGIFINFKIYFFINKYRSKYENLISELFLAGFFLIIYVGLMTEFIELSILVLTFLCEVGYSQYYYM